MQRVLRILRRLHKHVILVSQRAYPLFFAFLIIKLHLLEVEGLLDEPVAFGAFGAVRNRALGCLIEFLDWCLLARHEIL